MRETKRQRDDRFVTLGSRGVVIGALEPLFPTLIQTRSEIKMSTAAPTPPPAPSSPPAGQKGHVATAQKALDAFAKAAGLPAGSSADSLLKMFQACQAAVLAGPSPAAVAAVDDNGTHDQASLRSLTVEDLALCAEMKLDPKTFATNRARRDAERGSR